MIDQLLTPDWERQEESFLNLVSSAFQQVRQGHQTHLLLLRCLHQSACASLLFYLNPASLECAPVLKIQTSILLLYQSSYLPQSHPSEELECLTDLNHPCQFHPSWIGPSHFHLGCSTSATPHHWTSRKHYLHLLCHPAHQQGATNLLQLLPLD